MKVNAVNFCASPILNDILYIFREREIAICLDIQKIFQYILIYEFEVMIKMRNDFFGETETIKSGQKYTLWW